MYIQLYYDGCPEKCPMIGTLEYPVYIVGNYEITESGRMNFYFPFPEILEMFDGKMVNIWIEDLGDRYIRNVLFSKDSYSTPQLVGFLQLSS